MRDVEDAAADREVDWLAVLAVVFDEGAGCEGAEDGGGFLRGEGRRRGGSGEGVADVSYEAEEEGVEGGEEGGSGGIVSSGREEKGGGQKERI